MTAQPDMDMDKPFMTSEGLVEANRNMHMHVIPPLRKRYEEKPLSPYDPQVLIGFARHILDDQASHDCLVEAGKWGDLTAGEYERINALHRDWVQSDPAHDTYSKNYRVSVALARLAACGIVTTSDMKKGQGKALAFVDRHAFHEVHTLPFYGKVLQEQKLVTFGTVYHIVEDAMRYEIVHRVSAVDSPVGNDFHFHDWTEEEEVAYNSLGSVTLYLTYKHGVIASRVNARVLTLCKALLNPEWGRKLVDDWAMNESSYFEELGDEACKGLLSRFEGKAEYVEGPYV